MKKKLVAPSASHDEALIIELRNDPKLAAEFLRVALEDVDEEGGDYLLQKTLRLLAEAQGVAKVAKASGIPRESLYRALSARGNPRLSTLQAVTAALGLHLTVAPRA